MNEGVENLFDAAYNIVVSHGNPLSDALRRKQSEMRRMPVRDERDGEALERA